MLSECSLKWLCQFTFFWYYEAWKLLPVWVLIPFPWLLLRLGISLYSYWQFITFFLWTAYLHLPVFLVNFFLFDLLLPLYVADTNPLFYILQMFSPSLLSLCFPFFSLFHLIFFLIFFFFWKQNSWLQK